MYKNNYQRLDILGAGPAGLGVGYYAKQNRINKMVLSIIFFLL